MFAWIKKASAFVHATFDKCMSIPDYNSRLVFLGTTVFTQILMCWHTFNYLHAPAAERDANYPQIMLILLGGHGVTCGPSGLPARIPGVLLQRDACVQRTDVKYGLNWLAVSWFLRNVMPVLRFISQLAFA